MYYHFDGPVRILSLENGDPVDTTKNVGLDVKKAFMGLTRAFLQLNKTIFMLSGKVVRNYYVKSQYHFIYRIYE